LRRSVIVRDLSTLQRLEALRAEESRWVEERVAVADRPRRKPGSTPPWLGAFCVALALHLAVLGLTLLARDGRAAPAPGTGGPTIDVMLLPAWPEPGVHPPQLGSSATPHRATVVAPPPTPSALPSAVATSVTVPVDPTHPAPTEASATSTVALPVAQNATAAADTPPSTPSAAEALWETRVLDKLVSLKRYPAQAQRTGQQDTVMVRFTVDRAGQVLSANISKSRGFSLLDAESLALIRRAGRLPTPPSEVLGDEIELIVPVQFVLRHAP